MKGFVPTPPEVVDEMVAKLFKHASPRITDTVLDPGCGTGSFIEGIARWCHAKGVELPRIVGIELDPRHIPEARQKAKRISPQIEVRASDFLVENPGTYDFVIGNPPYVPITQLSEDEKTRYRSMFETARGRFDLYLLFFEQATRCLNPGGRLVFITPEKYIYTETAAPLRRLLSRMQLEEVSLIDEETFGELTTYPTITTVVKGDSAVTTRVILRDGSTSNVRMPTDGSSWLPVLNGGAQTSVGSTLSDICIRISCGVATGADSIFVKEKRELDPGLKPFSYPTISGRELGPGNPEIRTITVMIAPYDREGRLLSEDRLGALADYLKSPGAQSQLGRRTCSGRKGWYAFHDSFPIKDMKRPKILCKDITMKPGFWVDHKGVIIPRHTVYYVVPKDPERIDELCDYLNSQEAADWLMAHCQRAANGFIRIQSNVLKRLPIPDGLSSTR